jgi:hypothetical protein
LHFSLYLGIPIIAFWVIGVPLAGFIYLFKKRNLLEDPIIFSRYRMIYQGLKPQYFYWEFLNVLRKTFLVGVTAFLS